MDKHDKGQVAATAAEIYEQFFVPALFIDWPAQVLKVAEVRKSHSVLDVACGTGVLAREAAALVGPDGKVIGVDINDGMLAVARTKSTDIDWQKATAEELPFEDDSFDRVVSQFALMFFANRTQALQEMLRVLKPGGQGGVAVWARLAETPGYAAVATMLRDLFSQEIANSIESPYCLGEISTLQELFEQSGAQQISINTFAGKARFASIDDWLYTDIKGWTLADVISDEEYAKLQEAAPHYLSEFVNAAGKVEFEAPAHIIAFRK